MNHKEYFYNCSKEYIDEIDCDLSRQIIAVISSLPKRSTQTEINNDLLWSFTANDWHYDTLSGATEITPIDLGIRDLSIASIKKCNKRELCRTTTTLNADWHTDFAKMFGSRLVQGEAQFGKVEAMFKDFCGFQIARYEQRLSLGIEIVMCEPAKYFAHRKASVGGMAYFDIAKNTLPAIGLNCPIWLIGIGE